MKREDGERNSLVQMPFTRALVGLRFIPTSTYSGTCAEGRRRQQRWLKQQQPKAIDTTPNTVQQQPQQSLLPPLRVSTADVFALTYLVPATVAVLGLLPLLQHSR